MAKEESKTSEFNPLTLSDSDSNFIREQNEDEGPISLILGQACTLLKQEKKKLNYLDRTLILSDLRIFVLKSGFMRKIDHSYLLLDLKEVIYREFDFDYRGLQLKFEIKNPNANKKNAPPRLNEEIICASKDKSQVLYWIGRLMIAINALKQCLVFDPLIDIPPECGHSLEPIYDKQKLILAYQTLCAKNNVPVRIGLLQLFNDDAFYWNDFIDFFQILRSTVDKKKNSKKGFVCHPIEIAILLKSLHYVGNSFSALHLDALDINEDIIKGVANLLTSNSKFKTLALRSTRLTPKLVKLLNDRLKEKNGNKRSTQLDGLVLSTNDFSDPQAFLAIDPSNIQTRKLYIQDCKLTKDSFEALITHLLLSKEWNSTDKYGLQKVDMSDNFKKQDALVTKLFSQWLKQVKCNLREFRMGNCGLSLNFIQDLASNKELFSNSLKFLDLSSNDFSPYCAGALKQILSETSSIELLTLSEMAVPGILLTEFLAGIFKNTQCHMTIDLTRCGLNKYKFSDSLAEVISEAKKDTKAKDTTDAGLRGLILTRNELHTDVGEFGAICRNLSNFDSIERLILDFNFFYNKKKGYYAPIVTELVNSLKQMKSIQTLSIRGNYDNSGKINSKTSYLLEYDDLIPLFKYVGGGANGTDEQTDGEECNLRFLYLDGNHLGEKGCKMLGENLKFNSKLEILSCENCKISLKGLKLLLAGVTGVDQSIYDILPLQTLKILKDDTSKKNWQKFTAKELNTTLDVCRKNLEKIEAIRKADKSRRKTEARERRKTIEQDGKKDEAKTQSVKDNDDAPADKDLLATGDDDESSSTDDLLDGYATPGVGGEGSPMMTGKSQQTKVLRLARLLQNNNSGGLPISMGARPSGLIKPFMGAAGTRRGPGVAPLKGANSESKHDDSDDEKASEYITPMGARSSKSPKDINGMKVLDTDSTQAKLQAPKGPQQGRKKRTRKKLDV